MAMKFIIDMDGVVYRGSTPLPYGKEFIEFLQKNEIKFVFATNNSTKTRKMFAEKLARMGINVLPERIITSAYATAKYLEKTEKYGRAIIVGEIGIVEEMKSISWDVLKLDKWREATHVIVGMDRTLTYAKLMAGCLAINNGAKFVATNGDVNYPSEEGLIPGAGSMVAALEAATGKRALVIGKPNEPYIEIIKDKLGEGEYWVVGDRADTDMILGRKIGAKNVLLLTGVAKNPGGMEDHTFEDLGKFMHFLEENI